MTTKRPVVKRGKNKAEKPLLPALADVEKVLGPARRWAGRCYEIRVSRPVVGHDAAWRLADRLVPRDGRGILCMKCGCTRHIAGYWGTVTRRQECQADGGVFEFERGVVAT